ncbi:hypothetical protein [Niameybacter massiliensis]|uniref:hypothetical protein n=1 Tax=Niameybacter massiliensis TaxID=1658108 RepID=UPI0006B494E9|nr:hypothetical protein [Niameybacter massiliensis]
MKNTIDMIKNTCEEIEQDLLVDRLRVLQIIDVVGNIKNKLQLDGILDISIDEFPIQPTEEDTYECVLQYQIVKDKQMILIAIILEFGILNGNYIDWDLILNNDNEYLNLYCRLMDFNIHVTL